MTSAPSAPTRLRTGIAYAAMFAGAVGGFLALRSYGETLTAPPAPPADRAAGGGVQGHGDTFAHVLLALAVITLVARLLGGICRRYLRQPPVMGEILAGILLGPSLLGAVAPDAYAFLLPADAVPYLGAIAKIGVVLFMFLVGLHFDLRSLGGQTRTSFVIAHAGTVVPFLLGGGLAIGLYPVYSTRDVSFTVFALFLGLSLSVTAFPVLARILRDRKAQGTRLGILALACAAVGDVTAWTLLTLVTAVASAQVTGMAWKVGALVAYIVVMIALVGPLLARFAARQDARRRPASQTALAIVFAGVLLSACTTELLGVHALFGAFLLGTLLPHAGGLADGIRARLEDVVLVLFLPSFFALTGMRTEIGLLGSTRDWLVCGLIVLVATVGKLGGTFIAARMSGLPSRGAAALGILMNTRGLMELIVLSVGLDLKVITPTVFTMMVIMALVTTFSATPILDLLLGRRGLTGAAADTAMPNTALAGDPVGNPAGGTREKLAG